MQTDIILEAYTGLSILDLARNKFTGSIPETITNLRGLYHLNLAGNNISGALPHHFSNFMGMKGTHDEFPILNEINMSVTTKGQERYYFNSAIYEMVSIDLSSNHLTGVIPEEITTIDGVVNLNLSRNNLTGKISERIRVMQSLESLNLYENRLWGGIPQSLSNLSYLSFMELSHNNLTEESHQGGSSTPSTRIIHLCIMATLVFLDIFFRRITPTTGNQSMLIKRKVDMIMRHMHFPLDLA